MLRHEWADSTGVITRPIPLPLPPTPSPCSSSSSSHFWRLCCCECPWTAIIAYHQMTLLFIWPVFHEKKQSRDFIYIRLLRFLYDLLMHKPARASYTHWECRTCSSVCMVTHSMSAYWEASTSMVDCAKLCRAKSNV